LARTHHSLCLYAVEILCNAILALKLRVLRQNSFSHRAQGSGLRAWVVVWLGNKPVLTLYVFNILKCCLTVATDVLG